MSEVAQIKTFLPTDNSWVSKEFEGTYRKGELKGIINVNQKRCVGCDTCRQFCPTGAMQGEMGVAHKIDHNLCVSCGQCLINCPFGAIEQMSFVNTVMEKLSDPKKFVVAIPAPAVRVAIAEEFGAKPGELTVHRLYNACEKAGFHVYDNNFAADQTIFEEGTEFIKKIRYWVLGERGEGLDEMAEHPFPHFTSCCPAWVRNAEIFHPELLPHISGAKSPMQMAGPLAKTWAAKFVWNKDPRDIYTVGVMPCTAKIYEASRPEFKSAYAYLKKNNQIPQDTPPFPDIDAVLTTRDLAELFRRKGINPLTQPNEWKGSTTTVYTGGATIFGNSGGVLEAALRMAFFILSGRELSNPDITAVRGYNHNIVETTVSVPIKALNGKTFGVKVAVVNGAARNLDEIIKRIKNEPDRYHFVEVMNCPGGCINGGGQPVRTMGTSWLHSLLPLPLRA